MKQGVTFQAIAEAAESLQAEGHHPTIDRIREFLGGTGSNTTIAKYLNAWREQKNILKETEPSFPPDPVQAAVKRVWQEIRDETDAQIEKIKAEARAQIESALKQVHITDENFTKLQQEYTELTHSFHQLSAEKELLLLDLKSIREEHRFLEEKYSALNERYHDMQAATTKHFQDLKDAHHQEINKLDRTYQKQIGVHEKHMSDMKNQHEAERHQQMALIDSLKVANQKQESDIYSLKDKLKKNEIHIAGLTKAHHAMEKERNTAVERLNVQDTQLKMMMDKALIDVKLIEKLNHIPDLFAMYKTIEENLSNALNAKLNKIHYQLDQLQKLHAEVVNE